MRPVRRAPRAARLGAFALACAWASGCGYHAVYGGAERARLHVHLARAPIADAIAAGEVASGVREELAREGALAGGEDGFPRVEIEVTRVDEASEGIAAATGPGGGGSALAPSGLGDGTRVPAARGTEVGVVARAWVVRAEGAEPERDTGDVRALDLVGTTTAGTATADVAAVDALRHDDAVRAAARRVGVALAKRILGEALPADEGTGREP
jgi:hypothetical protein